MVGLMTTLFKDFIDWLLARMAAHVEPLFDEVAADQAAASHAADRLREKSAREAKTWPKSIDPRREQ
jgi:hypothetical protein